MSGQATIVQTVPEFTFRPSAPWDSDNIAIYPEPQPSLIGWQVGAAIPPYSALLEMPSINNTQGLCKAVAVSACRSLRCLNGVDFAIAPYMVSESSRLALDAGSPDFVQGVELYSQCIRSVSGGWTRGPNEFL
jgi:hypothetical protein